MKKYLALFLVTGVLIAGVVTTGKILDKPNPQVSVYALKPQLVEKTVLCSGTVESAESLSVYTDMSCIAGQVLVKAGDQVKRGDVLFTVDVDATKEVLATAGGLSPDTLPDIELTREIVAPASGIVTTLNAAQGEITDGAKPCAVISSSEDLQVKVSIHEKDIKNAKVGQRAAVSGSAFSKDSYMGELTYISPSARQQYVGSISETVVDAIITLDKDELDESLRMGLTARARLVVGSTKDALVVPYDYVLQDEAGTEYVYVYQEGRAIRRDVTAGEELSEGYLIVSGLSAGDRIVQEPASIKKDGETVTLKS